jgi:hypothetical protein
VEPARLEEFAREFSAELHAEFLSRRKPPPRLHVLVTTSELREAGPPELLPRLRMTISEEAVEWTIVDTEGKPSARLVPE